MFTNHHVFYRMQLIVLVFPYKRALEMKVYFEQIVAINIRCTVYPSYFCMLVSQSTRWSFLSIIAVTVSFPYVYSWNDFDICIVISWTGTVISLLVLYLMYANNCDVNMNNRHSNCYKMKNKETCRVISGMKVWCTLNNGTKYECMNSHAMDQTIEYITEQYLQQWFIVIHRV